MKLGFFFYLRRILMSFVSIQPVNLEAKVQCMGPGNRNAIADAIAIADAECRNFLVGWQLPVHKTQRVACTLKQKREN